MSVWRCCWSIWIGICLSSAARSEDVSPPVLLQWFEAKYETMERRLPDFFVVGYGGTWIPPVGRAGTEGLGGFSVGYDPFDRFDLGQPGRETKYGTEEQLRRVAEMLHRAGADLYIDFVINHNGFRDRNSVDGANSFLDAGDYPGFVLKTANDPNGDFNSPDATDVIHGRPQGHGVDIDQDKPHRFIRNPVPGFPNNIPAGTVHAFGRIADVASNDNRRFYPDKNLPPIFLFDPETGDQGIQVFPFNLTNPLDGDPVEETGMGYLMRNAQWLVQVVGADGFRIDAAKHVSHETLRKFDRAVYRANLRKHLDGSQRHVFSFGETKDRRVDVLKPYLRTSIDPGDPGKIGGNRDTLDFATFDAVKENLTDNGLTNDWRRVRLDSLDAADNGLLDGSAGVKFVSSHDDDGPFLSNVAYAHLLMLPGNAIVYSNAAGSTGNFPKPGRGDALSGLFGDRIARLVGIRTTHGRGNYRERLLEKELYAFEREGSAVVLLSNRLDGGFDSRTLPVSFPPGTPLIELTGNASDPKIDPHDDIPPLVTVTGNRKINVRFPRNRNSDGESHNSGYLVYGLAPPQAPAGLELIGVDHVQPGETPTVATNGTARLTPIHVITAPTFEIRLKTVPVNLLGSIRDREADGDQALFRIDEGIDGNGSGQVDFRTPNQVTYGFERFVDKQSPLSGGGDGEFRQKIDATRLAPGVHFVEVCAFRHRPGGGPPITSRFRKVIAIER